MNIFLLMVMTLMPLNAISFDLDKFGEILASNERVAKIATSEANWKESEAVFDLGGKDSTTIIIIRKEDEVCRIDRAFDEYEIIGIKPGEENGKILFRFKVRTGLPSILIAPTGVHHLDRNDQYSLFIFSAAVEGGTYCNLVLRWDGSRAEILYRSVSPLFDDGIVELKNFENSDKARIVIHHFGRLSDVYEYLGGELVSQNKEHIVYLEKNSQVYSHVTGMRQERKMLNDMLVMRVKGNIQGVLKIGEDLYRSRPSDNNGIGIMTSNGSVNYLTCRVMGDVCLDNGNTDKARDYYRKAIASTRQDYRFTRELEIDSNCKVTEMIGDYYCRIGNYARALDLYREAINIMSPVEQEFLKRITEGEKRAREWQKRTNTGSEMHWSGKQLLDSINQEKYSLPSFRINLKIQEVERVN